MEISFETLNNHCTNIITDTEGKLPEVINEKPKEADIEQANKIIGDEILETDGNRPLETLILET